MYDNLTRTNLEFAHRDAERRIAQLEKENAELKELLDCKHCGELEESECGSCVEFGHFRCKGKEQLRKAEDIIRSLYFIIQGRIDDEGNIPLEDEMYRAKQFLNKVS